MMEHESREQETTSIVDTYISALKSSLESLSTNLQGSLTGQSGKKVKEVLAQQASKIQEM